MVSFDSVHKVIKIQEYGLLLNFHSICETLSNQTLVSLLPKEYHSCIGQLPLCCSSGGDNLCVSSLSFSQMSTDANCCVLAVCTLTDLSANAHPTVFCVTDFSIISHAKLPAHWYFPRCNVWAKNAQTCDVFNDCLTSVLCVSIYYELITTFLWKMGLIIKNNWSLHLKRVYSLMSGSVRLAHRHNANMLMWR